MDQRSASGLVDSGSNSSMNGIPRITLSLDNSSSALNALSDLPEDKRKILEHRMVNNPHAKNVETVVGFGENSRDKSYIPGAPVQSENSRDRLYISGAQINNENSRDKAYTPGAPITPLKPCSSAAQAEAASRPSKDDVSGAIVSSRTTPKVNDSHSSSKPNINTKLQENILYCQEHLGARSSAPLQTSVNVGFHSISALETGNYSAEELESSDDDSQGSSSSIHGPAKMQVNVANPRILDEEDDELLSVERKRKLFSSEDGSANVIGAKEEGKTTLPSEKISKKSTKNPLKRSRSHVDPTNEFRPSDRSPPKNARTITSFFTPTNQPAAGSLANLDLSPAQSAGNSLNGIANSGQVSSSETEKDRLYTQRLDDLEARERAATELERDIARKIALQSKFEEEAQQRALASVREQQRARDLKVTEVVRNLLVEKAKEERAHAVARLNSDSNRVGRVSYMRGGMGGVSEMWEDGTAMTELNRRFTDLAAEKDRLDKDKKAYKDKCKAAHAGGASHGSQSGAMPPPAPPSEEMQEQEEIFRIRAMKLKQKEQALVEEKEKLEREKYTVIREYKRINDQNRSKYNGFPVLNKRYLLLHLLGKGGFSEVYRAYDLVELQDVACKIHELNSQWSDEKKANYMKHATRECEIQKKLNHHRIVRLLDVFEVSSDGFCTVLEFCDGGDLEQILKGQKTVPEREARAIILQICQGLRYLNEQKPVIIHYDLKPANIVFHHGEVKLSDFGLSKIMTEGEQGMELTSQGAGTYWYMAPECFERGPNPPIITSKVDVWSVGVIFYQILFGVKPFGHGMSQEAILINGIIEKSGEVQFPSNKEVKASQPAKEFIRKCLQRSPAARPSPLEVINESYLRQQGRQASSTGTEAAGGGAKAAAQ